mmetsp:Transcript_81410/g.217731  ORF Transcript_81410/g.217731 Transcript_81410/m.217731 type:complete len:225 (+) Transcript_81410:1345-2019(+)
MCWSCPVSVTIARVVVHGCWRVVASYIGQTTFAGCIPIPVVSALKIRVRNQITAGLEGCCRAGCRRKGCSSSLLEKNDVFIIGCRWTKLLLELNVDVGWVHRHSLIQKDCVVLSPRRDMHGKSAGPSVTTVDMTGELNTVGSVATIAHLESVILALALWDIVVHCADASVTAVGVATIFVLRANTWFHKVHHLGRVDHQSGRSIVGAVKKSTRRIGHVHIICPS